VIPEELRADMLDGVPAPMLGAGARYGLGVILRDWPPLGEVRGHSGFFPGWQTELHYVPGGGFAVALQFNSSERGGVSRPPGLLARRFATAVAEASGAVAPATEPAAAPADEPAAAPAPAR
jgi:hypothetical protein